MGKLTCAISFLVLFISGCASQEQTLRPLSTREQGAQLFTTHCAGCHAAGGNTMNPNKPIKGSTKLAEKARFVAFLRNPGGGMPAYDAAVISDSDADVLRQYMVSEFGQ